MSVCRATAPDMIEQEFKRTGCADGVELAQQFDGDAGASLELDVAIDQFAVGIDAARLERMEAYLHAFEGTGSVVLPVNSERAILKILAGDESHHGALVPVIHSERQAA